MRYTRVILYILLLLVLTALPLRSFNAAADNPVIPHSFLGYVTTSSGAPAAGVEVTAWVNGFLSDTITTDASGEFGSDPLSGIGQYLYANGNNGDRIVMGQVELGFMQVREEEPAPVIKEAAENGQVADIAQTSPNSENVTGQPAI